MDPIARLMSPRQHRCFGTELGSEDESMPSAIALVNCPRLSVKRVGWAWGPRVQADRL